MGDADNKHFCYNLGGDAWVANGLDHNDNCYSADNAGDQCIPTPCEEYGLNQMISRPLNGMDLLTLRNSILSGDQFERAYPMYENAEGYIQFGLQQQGALNEPEVNIQMSPGQGQEIAGYFHSHYQGTDYTFSADDLYNYIFTSWNSGNGLAGDIMGVVNPNGTAYAAVFEDIGTLTNYLIQDWDNDPVSPPSFIALETFSTALNTAQMMANVFYPNDPEKAGELAMLSFFDDTGMTLYKSTVSNNMFTDFKKLSKTVSGTAVEPCID